MKKLVLLVMLIGALSVHAQSLKETLYSGKLKTDTGTVIRKGDDLSSKIDTSTKKPVVVEPEKMKMTSAVGDGPASGLTTQMDSTAVPGVVPRDNNAIWKEYIDSFTTIARAEILPSRKVKNGTYSVLIEYEIGIDGQITVNNVSCSPESSFLGQQIKERLTLTVPQMTPLLSSNGKPRIAAKKQTLVLTK